MRDSVRIFIGLLAVVGGTILIGITAASMLPIPWSLVVAFILSCTLGFIVSMWVMQV